MTGNIHEFTCKPIVMTYNTENFKIYAVEVDEIKHPNIMKNTYKSFENVIIKGNFHELALGIDYIVKATEEKSKNNSGYQYKVVNIKRDRPHNDSSTRIFLSEILTPNQVDVLMSVYPDIVDRVINHRLSDIDLNKTYGIKDYTFNVIKRKIEENFVFAELIEGFNGMLDLSTLKKLYEKYPSIQKIKQAIKNDPYECFCSLNRIGFKTADSLIRELDKESKKKIKDGEEPIVNFDYELETSPQREKAVIKYLLNENENDGNTRISLSDLKSKTKQLAPACYNHFVDVIKQSDEIYVDANSKSIALKETYEKEVYIANKILNALTIDIDKNNEGDYYYTKWKDIDVSKYRESNNIELTEQQLGSLSKLINNNITILNGFAGSGKSATVASVINMLEDNGKRYILLTPTGRASKVLAGYTKRDAKTIHRGLLYGVEGWYYNENNKLEVDVVIADESSMIDVDLMKHLIEAIDFEKTKLMMVGDGFQIPSVGAGNIFFDMINSNKIPITTLTQIFRYGKGGVMTVATQTRQGEEFIDKNISGVQTFGEDKGYVYLPFSQEKVVDKVKALYSKLLNQGETPEDILILSSYNKGDYGTVKINEEIQKIANTNYNSDIKFKVLNTTYYINDMVIQTVNNYKAEIYEGNNESCFICEPNKTFISNGDIGKVILIEKSYMIVKFDDYEIKYYREDALQLKLAYSISCHKSQGGAAKIIILLTPKAHTFFLNANLIYVGQTRATNKVYHFGESTTINRAIKEHANFNRKTFLKDLININKK